MEILTASLAAIWAWGFLRTWLGRLPEWLLYLTVVPLVAYLALHAPSEARNICAVAGSVMLVQFTLFKGFLPTRTPIAKRRRSNIPPPP